MEDLVSLINQWNINRVELFALSLPNENGEFCGVMRFCYQDAGQKVATKCVRVCSNATTLDVIDSLIEKFRADIKMLSVPQYGLYEIHENGEERKLEDDERPLLVQLNWHKDDREGRFLLKRIDEKSTGESGTLTRKLSKSGKKDKKKKEKNEESKESSLAGKLYDELPETCFTRSISNPEAVMKRRRKQKLEKKLQLLQQNGPDAGGTLRIFGECLNPDVPYKTLLLSAKDTARYVVQQILEKYREIGNFQEAEPASSYCLVLVIEPPQDRLIQYVLDDNDCPLAIKQKHNPARGQLTFHIRKRSVDCQPQITPSSPQVPSQIPSQQLPPQVPSQQLPPQIPSQLPPQFPPQLPTQIPLQLQSQLPLQIPVQLPSQSSQLPSQSSQSSQSSPQLALQSHSMRQMTQSHSMLPPPYHHTIDLGHRIYDNLHGVATSSSSMNHFPSPSPSPVPFTIQLRKSSSGLGFSIVAARSLRTGQGGIYVKSVIKGGTADLDGRLQPGDQLLSVNNHSLIDVPQEKAAKLMTQSSIVTLEVAKRAAYYNGLATALNEVQRATPQLPPQYQSHYSSHHLPHHPTHHPPQYQPHYQPHHPPLHPLDHPHQPRHPPPIHYHVPQHPVQFQSHQPPQHPLEHRPQHFLHNPSLHQTQPQPQPLAQHLPYNPPQNQSEHLSHHSPQHPLEHTLEHHQQNPPQHQTHHKLEHLSQHQLQHPLDHPLETHPRHQTQQQPKNPPQLQPQLLPQHIPHNPPHHKLEHLSHHPPQHSLEHHPQHLPQNPTQNQPQNPTQNQSQNPTQHQLEHLSLHPPQHSLEHHSQNQPQNQPQNPTQNQPQNPTQNPSQHQTQHQLEHLSHHPPQHQPEHSPQLPSIASLLEEISEAIENDPSDDDDENFPPNNFKSYGPNVIGANEIYKDPRERIEAEKMKTQPQKTILAGPEKLTFQEKLQLFT